MSEASMRQQPGGWPVMHQVWDRLLFLHWPMDAKHLRPLIPPELEIDTWEGTAWIGVTPFTIRGIRPPLMPALPVISTSHELNVRTYVQRNGEPRVWFLSLDASNSLAVWAARLGFGLPYFRAKMKMTIETQSVHFESSRTHAEAPPATFRASWKLGSRFPDAAPATRDFFLIERYALYSSSGDRLYQAGIHHRPWPLSSARVDQLDSTLLKSHGLIPPREVPVVHAQAEPLHVWIWPTKRVA